MQSLIVFLSVLNGGHTNASAMIRPKLCFTYLKKTPKPIIVIQQKTVIFAL